MKMKIAALTLFGLFVLSFQNCSKILATNSCDDGTISTQSCPETLSKVIDTNEVLSNTPFKLLIVVDNSNTMSQNQAKLAQNIDSLLLPLMGRNVDVKLISTSSDIGGPGYATFYDEIIKNDASLPTMTDILADPNVLSLNSNQVNGEGNGSLFQFSENQTQAQMATVLQNLKNRIVSFGIDGSDNEEVICPILRHLKNIQSKDSFFKMNDKAAIFILTDENDSSSASNCRAGHIYKYGIVDQSVQSRFKADVNIIKFTVSNFKSIEIRDGVTKVTSKPVTIAHAGTDIVIAADVYNNTCASKVQNYLRSTQSKKWDYANWDYSEAIVKDCSVETVEATAYYTLSSTDYCNFNNTINLSNQFFNLEQYTNRVGIVVSKPNIPGLNPIFLTAYVGNCHVEKVPKNSRASSYAHVHYSGFEANVINEEFDRRVGEEMQKVFGNNFFVSFLANGEGASACPLNAGQSMGARYNSLASRFSENMQVFPICANTYAPAVARLSQFVAKISNKIYDAELPSTAVVTKVLLLRNSTVQPLNVGEYKIQDGKIELLIALEAQDKIKIHYHQD